MVVGIIAILVSVLSLGIRRIRAGFELRHAAGIVVSEVRRAQTAAIAEGGQGEGRYTVEFVLTSPYGLKVYKGTNSVLPVRQVSGAGWPSSIKIQEDQNGPVSSLFKCRAGGMPAVGDQNNSRCVTFGFLGAPVVPGDIQLESETGGVLRIVVQAATGRVSAEP